MKKWMLLLLMAAMALTPAFGASENSVDRNLSVGDDYQFKPGNAFVYLQIREPAPNDFGANPISFRLKISQAKWFEAGNAAEPAVMATDTLKIAGATAVISRLSDQDLEVTLNRSAANTAAEAWWKIPIYAEVSAAGAVSIEVDGRDSVVSSGAYDIAVVPDGTYLNSGYRFTPDNQQWITFKEPQPNAFSGTQSFKLLLDNGTWFADSDSRLNAQAMLKASAVSGIENGSITEIRRVDDHTMALTIQRGATSSIKGSGVWSIPLYFTVEKSGTAKITVDSQGSKVAEGTLGSGKVTLPVRYIKTVTLTLNQPLVVMKQGSDERSVALDVSPVNPSGSTMIPVRGVFEQLGAKVQWNGQTRDVSILSEDQTIILNADSAGATVNGTSVVLTQPPKIINGRLLIPLRSVSEQLGFGVEWVETTKQIIIRQD